MISSRNLLLRPPKYLPVLNLNRTLISTTQINDAALHTEVFSESTQEKLKSVLNLLSDCGNLSQLNQIHAQIIRTQFLQRHFAPFYWNSIIRSYSNLNASYKALYIYIAMSRAGVLPDSYTLPIILKTGSQIFAVLNGEQIHCSAVKLRLECNEFCETGLISYYCKAGNFKSARKLFDENPDRKLGSWNAIISGLTQSGRAREALDMFIMLRENGLEPDGLTMVCVTSACGTLGDLNLALQLHKYVFRAENNDKSGFLMLNSLIDMYGKCGKMDLAYKVFLEMDKPNVSAWTSMIVGYAMHGHVNEALECFDCMRGAGLRPNHVTFVGVLSACVHGGRVEEGKHYFGMMKIDYGIVPTLQHYGCMVDLLGRAGLLDEAKEMIEGMPMEANVVIWGCLMGACEKHGNVEMGEVVAKRLQELEPWNDGVYVVLSNIYADKGLWQEAARVRGFMKQRKVAKIPAYSFAVSSSSSSS